MGAAFSAGAPVPVVLTLTTIPWRLNAELQKRLFALLDGLPPHFTLVLNVPHVFKRDGTPYPDVPSGLLHHPRITVRRVDDIGPITKVLPTLQRIKEMGARCVVIVIDDDVWYAPAYIAALARGVTPQSHFVKGITSGDFYYAGRVPEGVSGYALPSGIVTPGLLADLTRWAGLASCVGADDYVLGAALQAAGVPLQEFALPRYGAIPRPVPLAAMEVGSLAYLSASSNEDFRARYNRCKVDILMLSSAAA